MLVSVVTIGALVDYHICAAANRLVVIYSEQERSLERHVQPNVGAGASPSLKSHNRDESNPAASKKWAKIGETLGPGWRTELINVQYKGGIHLEYGKAELLKCELSQWPEFVKAVRACEALEGVEVPEVSLETRNGNEVPGFRNASFEIVSMDERPNQEDDKE